MFAQGQPQRGIVELDLHGMTVTQAQVAIDAKLRRCGREVFRLRLIHGYHHGSSIRDMIQQVYRKHPKVLRLDFGYNPGETDLVLREL